ncbi:hypothetical protein GOP47_0012731 [Adiantum capillus-veneris]|uniref:Uncharacterized protein n=1 Tax=Adiantum capillus-veneris TaxID=13818 RepID=A0A9D4ZGR8_ADICA|nr:hypothetical protein GOP47_0012731 [Adiantum capillus-veneris]
MISPHFITVMMRTEDNVSPIAINRRRFQQTQAAFQLLVEAADLSCLAYNYDRASPRRCSRAPKSTC